jgi:hypothetical protein
MGDKKEGIYLGNASVAELAATDVTNTHTQSRNGTLMKNLVKTA